MLTSSDLIHLPYTTSLSEGGIAFAKRWLACTNEHIGRSPLGHLQRIASEAAAELAFRRHLSEHAVPHQVLGAAPFTHPDQYDVSLGRHRCVVMSYLITRRSQIVQIRRDPGRLLEAQAMFTMDEFASQEHKDDDLYLFVFMLGVVTKTMAEIDKASEANLPVSLMHTMPVEWARPVNWLPLGELVLKSECEEPVTVELGGQDADRNFIAATILLPPRQRISMEKSFHSLAYLLIHSKPSARIGIRTRQHSEPYLIPAHSWGNLWIYGMDIIFTGWLTHEDFRHKANVLNTGAHTFQVYDTRKRTWWCLCGNWNRSHHSWKR